MEGKDSHTYQWMLNLILKNFQTTGRPKWYVLAEDVHTTSED